MEKSEKLELISEKTREIGTYTEREKVYKCPCGKGTVVWSKERPNGTGSGYEATFSDTFWNCADCMGKYRFSSLTETADLIGK